jgi:murein L,D-transpeptidase YafK
MGFSGLCLAWGVWLGVASAAGDFAAQQEKAPRVRAARQHVSGVLKERFKDLNVAYPPARVFIRAFKVEKELEVWAGGARGPLTLIKTYAVCAVSGGLGPKRQEGDGQIPEGFYEVDRFNPASNYHLSLGVSYPNASDRLRSRAKRLGGDIMIHGDCVTIGCLPLTDPMIEEVYVLVVDARSGGAGRVPVHIFPRRMDAAGMAWLTGRNPTEDLAAFWEELRAGYSAFEKDHVVPTVSVDPRNGSYRVR